MKAHTYRHATVVDALGLAITSGELQPGTVLRAEELVAEFGVSRSVVREGLRVLETLGMATSRRNVGITIQPASSWNVFDPLVIRWRLAGEGRAAQLHSLTLLRSAVEPLAAELAAKNIADDDAARLVHVAHELLRTAQAGDLEEFLVLDIEFHRLILHSSGNEMLAHLDSAIAEVLTGRTHYGLMPDHPQQEARELHLSVAMAIAAHQSLQAGDAMRRIVGQAAEEMEETIGE